MLTFLPFNVTLVSYRLPAKNVTNFCLRSPLGKSNCPIGYFPIRYLTHAR